MCAHTERLSRTGYLINYTRKCRAIDGNAECAQIDTCTSYIFRGRKMRMLPTRTYKCYMSNVNKTKNLLHDTKLN